MEDDALNRELNSLVREMEHEEAVRRAEIEMWVMSGSDAALMNEEQCSKAAGAKLDLNNALVNADISNGYEESLKLFDHFYDENVEVASGGDGTAFRRSWSALAYWARRSMLRRGHRSPFLTSPPAAICLSLPIVGTRITTNIQTGDEEQRDGFNLVDASSIRRKHGLDGRLRWVEIKLSEWVFNVIRSQEVLTLDRDYVRLGKPLERRMYELARKHCGRQSRWHISLEVLLKKSGSQSSLKLFRQMVKSIARQTV